MIRALSTYLSKRDLAHSGEPDASGAREDEAGPPRFVIQKHDASALHYDLRLQAGGVLASWAVPKGPSTDPREKRLALRTEDHPLDYAEFEGVIPEGQYGAGTVLVWDRGSFANITETGNGIRPVAEALEAGHLLVWLEGQKLRGGYALQRIDCEEGQWLLIKMDDEAADARRNPVSTEPRSVLSGRRVSDIAREVRE